MKKNDIIFPLVIGEAIALIILLISRNIQELGGIPYLWLLVVILPLLCLFGVSVAYWLSKKIKVFFQLAKFLLTGVLNTFVDLGVLNVLILIFGISSGALYSVFKGFSFFVSVINSYFWNKFWTFKKTETGVGKREFGQFALVAGIGFFINVAIASFVVNVIGPQFGLSSNIWANVGAIIATVCVFTWNFLGYKFFVFKK